MSDFQKLCEAIEASDLDLARTKIMWIVLTHNTSEGYSRKEFVEYIKKNAKNILIDKLVRQVDKLVRQMFSCRILAVNTYGIVIVTRKGMNLLIKLSEASI